MTFLGLALVAASRAFQTSITTPESQRTLLSTLISLLLDARCVYIQSSRVVDL